MQHHTVSGGGGTRLHLIEAGNPDGQAILFLHGFSQCSLAWTRQLESDLGRTHRLVAMDLRGHGQSEKPHDAYGGSKLWADDVAAAIRELELDQPILCGWSYGPLVILDYIRHYGEDVLGGIHFVGAVTKLGSDDALSVLTPEFLGLVPGFFSSDTDETVRSLRSLLHMCFAREVSATDLYTMLGYNVAVPPSVRQALFSRAFDNDDLLPALQRPVLITHGGEDAVVKPSAVGRLRDCIPQAQLHMMVGAGHAPFWDDAAAFNARLAAFSDSVARRRTTELVGGD